MSSQEIVQQSSDLQLLFKDDKAQAVHKSPELRRGYREPGKKYRFLAYDLPPLHSLEEIFAHMARKALGLGLEHVLSQLGNRPLRVATMCSGTEAPLLALEMIQTGMDLQLRVSHAFSCEIVPLKQSYIERNFRPPILFRDITELGGDKGRTAYGSSEVIPGDLDVLVAGTACVDFSPLNNCKKTLQQGGESGATFDGLLQYAARYRPRLVIQENVRAAPWDQMEGKWRELGYVAVLVRIDTKHHYIPQTRERGYMVVIDGHRLGAAGLLGSPIDQGGLNKVSQHVRGLVCSLKRQASSPVGEWLLSDEDRRLELIEQRACLQLRSDASWDQYQIRHQRHRDQLDLGNERPLTRSTPGHSVLTAPDFYWHRFWQTQPERVWDTVDINFLKKISQSYDMNFKERWIDLSQGVDRGTDGLAGSGIAGCLTPRGIPFVTTRGGPVSGTEALSLQGLPLDRMLMTRETQSELMDMAGNAMTSTAVGAVMLASLIAVYQIFDTGDEVSTNPDDKEVKPLLVPNAQHSLMERELPDVPNRIDPALKGIAASTVIRCSCERQTIVKDRIYQCTLCGHTACNSCRGNPTHSYSPLSLSRRQPSDFIANTVGIVPMKLVITNLQLRHFEPLSLLDPIASLPDLWTDFAQCIELVLLDTFVFSEIKRGRKWRIVYISKHGHLHLEIGPDSIQWLLFAHPPKLAPAKSAIREILAKPVARFTPIYFKPFSSISRHIYNGVWELCSPLSLPFSLRISGQGDEVPSFESESGLKKAEFRDTKVWSTLLVEIEGSSAVLDHGVSGVYHFLPDCGTALGAMYKREATNHEPAMFLFLDSAKIGLPEDDACVFSLDHSRLPGYEVRMTVAELDPSWRSSQVTREPTSVSAFYRQWIQAPGAELSILYPNQGMEYHTLQTGNKISIDHGNCHNACLTIASLSAHPHALNLRDTATYWQSWDPEVSRMKLKKLTWLFSKLAACPDFENWNDIISPVPTHEHDYSNENCNICNPPSPSIIWGRNNSGRITPYENQLEAAVYERAIKARPSHFLIFRRLKENGHAELRVTLNIQALAHQARAKLAGLLNRETITSQWRLITQAYDMVKGPSTRFTLLDNAADIPSPQPPNFKKKLRAEQLRSLSWMISQEDPEIEPFIEEEIEESVLSLMSWRAEVKAAMPNTVRGGLIADEVGYGKTAIVLGLIDSQYEADLNVSREDDGLIAAKATLIIVPSNVCRQWAEEIQKFLGNTYKVLNMKSSSNITIQQVLDADIVLMPWSILANDTYYRRLHQLTGTPKVPSRSRGCTGRSFDSWFEGARDSLQQLVGILKTEGPEAMLQELEARRRQVEETNTNATFVPSRRLRGQAFADANASGDRPAVRAVATSGDDSGVSDTDPSESEDDSDDDAPDASGTQQKRSRSARSQTGRGAKRRKPIATVPGKPSKPKSGSTKKQKVPDDRKDFNIKGDKNQDWRSVKAALVHAFSFNRLIIDEYTYAGEERQASLVGLRARSKWILSGTPALDEFADIKSIARYLGVHLGIDDDADCDKPSHNLRLKNIRKNHTAAETFQFYQAPHSNAWYGHRRLHAQNFLDRFGRSNLADIKEIKLMTHIKIVGQTPTEEEDYNTLFQAVKDSRRRIDGPMNSILFKSQFPEEALIMGCTTSLIGKSPWCLESCLKGSDTFDEKSQWYWLQIESLCGEAAILWYRSSINKDGWKILHTDVMKGKFEDRVICDKFESLVRDCFETYKRWSLKDEDKHNSLSHCLDQREEKIHASNPTASDHTAAITKSLTSELISNLRRAREVDRTKRFYHSAVEAQTSSVLTCHNCKEDCSEKENLNVFKSCGHILCTSCKNEAKVFKKCIIESCMAKFSESQIIPGGTLIKDNNPDTVSSKLKELIQIIRDIPKDELALVFVQIGHLMPVVADALKIADIEHRMVTPGKLKVIEEFTKGPKVQKRGEQPPPRPKVLILNLGGAMAAGLNLQCANHVIFVSPLFTQNQYDWDSGMTQAIGRARRYGQQRTVNVYHLLVRGSYEVNIFQDRQNRKLVERNGVATLLPVGEMPLPTDVMLEGPRLRD
ncbi:unnamed protein product [Penicillium olsonii]|uniref:Helicase ATP-binding domain-containing protein n=1 Tax=Penicillium olsonii TaxID=99116 RepID=A0A9W4MM14_PENOL|nr:unnamed protein product [Penicillium olsonii]CAG8005648.1 unnamed protein product [Penicillium olsonii]